MGMFRLVGNSPALAYCAGRLCEEGHQVEWWSSGYFPTLRSLRLRSEAFHDLLLYFKRSHCDLNFVLNSPSVKSWTSLRDGGTVVRLLREMDEEFEDHYVDGSILFQKLKSAALSRGVKIKEFSASLPSPLVGLEKDWALITDVSPSEMRLWPAPPPSDSLDLSKFYHLQNIWFPSLGQKVLSQALQGISFAEWRGAQLLLEPHAERGCVLSVSSTSAYFLNRAVEDTLNPKVKGLSELRALYLMNGPRMGREQLKLTLGHNERSLPMAFHLGNSVGTFHPLMNSQDDFAFREAKNLITHCENNGDLESTSLMGVVSEWNQETSRRFQREHRLQLLWKKLLFSRSWGRYVLRASRYMPKTLRERFQSPA